MKPDGDRIAHLCCMVCANVYHSYSSNMDDSFGYLEQLKKQIEAGGFVSAGTVEELNLTKATTELRKLATAIEDVRNQLLLNMPPKFRVI